MSACGHARCYPWATCQFSNRTLAAPVPHPAAADPSEGGGGRE